jgi:hypothetical protein
MKKVYSLSVLFSVVLFAGCSKDFLKNYDDRIIGTWHITDVNSIGIGRSNTHNLPFTTGRFTFFENGTLNYVNGANVNFRGTWDIQRKVIGDETVRGLELTAIDFANQQVLSEYYDDMIFTGTDRFKASVTTGTRTYVTRFSR